MSVSLSLQSIKDIDFASVAGRLMRRQNIAVAVRVVQLCAISAVILALGVLAYSGATETLSRKSLDSELAAKVAAIKANTATSGTPVFNTTHDWKLVSDFTSFGPLGKAAPSAPSAAPAPKSPLMLALAGTFIAAGQEPYAIIEDKKKQSQEMFLLEQSVFGQAVLKKIMEDRVEVERNGRIEVLKLDDFGGGDSGQDGISSEGDDFVVDEAELDKGLENLPMLLTQARAVPYFKDGRSIGLRLFAIKTGSLYEKVGLKNGDILKSINGNGLGDISQAMKLFEQLKQERSITLTLERDKQEREFRYTIR